MSRFIRAVSSRICTVHCLQVFSIACKELNVFQCMGHRISKARFVSSSAAKASVVSKGSLQSHTPNHLATTKTGLPKVTRSTSLPYATQTLLTNIPTMSVHKKARCPVYPRTSDVNRFPIPDDKVPWDVDFPEYDPVDFTSTVVSSQPVWADIPDPSAIAFNKVDGKVNRCSHQVKVEKVSGYPRNPQGRTGLKGRGSLGRWGPNHAADPIVTRWKRVNDDYKNEAVKADDGRPILQFISVQRRDNGEWALPGGMVDPGEHRTATLIREFGEEALNSLEASSEEKLRINKLLTNFFRNGAQIYVGYVDDPRNTDNCWMETEALNFHDETGTGVGAFKLHAGDDAVGVQWMDISSSLKLYASHESFIKATAERLGAHW